jgi:hypothetical protein
MKHYVFTVHLSGYGETQQEAWEDSLETFQQDNNYAGEEFTVEDADWYEEEQP